jgi:hypothetical protein
LVAWSGWQKVDVARIVLGGDRHLSGQRVCLSSNVSTHAKKPGRDAPVFSFAGCDAINDADDVFNPVQTRPDRSHGLHDIGHHITASQRDRGR